MRQPGKMKPPARLGAPATLHAKIVKPSLWPARPTHRAATPPAARKPRKSKKARNRPAGPSQDLECGDQPPLLFVILLGLSGEPLRKRCDTIARLVRQRATEPLFLIDDDTSFAHFRYQSLPFEFVPPRAARALASPSLQWGLYDRRRAKLLHEKWQPAAVMAVGRTAREFAALLPPTPPASKRRRMVRILRRLRRLLQ